MVPFTLWSCAALALLALPACGQTVEQTAQAAMAADQCASDFPTLTTRAGEAGLATLQYACPREGCDGHEGLASGATQTVQLELPSSHDSQVQVTMSKAGVIKLESADATFDPCTASTRVVIQLKAHAAGSTELLVSDGDRALDRFALHVADTTRIELRASALTSFDFSKQTSRIQITLGEAVMLLPQLDDAAGRALIGTLPLRFRSDDPATVQVRTSPKSDDERFLLDSVAGSTALLEPQRAGVSRVRVTAPNGAEGVLDVQVLTPAAPVQLSY